MLRRTDIRFSADPATTASAKSLLLPIRIVSRGASNQQALRAARQVVTAFAKLCEATHRPGATISLVETATGTDGQRSGILSVQQRSAKEVQVEVEFNAAVAIDGPTEFWHRADVIAWAVDVVQAFGVKTWPKGVWVLPRRARLSAEPATSEETVDDLPDS